MEASYNMSADSVYLISKSLRESYRDGKLSDEQISRLRAIPGFRLEILPSRRRAVVCYETGEHFETIANVAKKYDISTGCAQQRIQKHRPMPDGLHIFYEEELPDEIEKNKTERIRTNGYICLETGTWYKTIEEIARTLNVSISSVRSAVRRHGSPGDSGLHFYPDGEDPKTIRFVSVKRRPIRCVETDMSFNDAGEAGRWLGREAPHYNNIYKALRKGTVAYGYHWEYEI